jgi:hypothetical protein
MFRAMVSFHLLSALTAYAVEIPSVMVEAETLLQTLAYDQSEQSPNIYDWKMAQSPKPLIVWDPDGNKWTSEGYRRKGYVVLSVDGKVTHHEIDSSVRHGHWVLDLLARQSIITYAKLTPSDTTQEKPRIPFNKIYVREKVVCDHGKYASRIGYRLRFPHKHDMWVEERTENNSRGSASRYVITFDRTPECVQAKLERQQRERALEQRKKEEQAALEKAQREIEELQRKKKELEAIRKAEEARAKREEEELRKAQKELTTLQRQNKKIEAIRRAEKKQQRQYELDTVSREIAFLKFKKSISEKMRKAQEEIASLLTELNATETNGTSSSSEQGITEIKRQLLQQQKRLLAGYQREWQEKEAMHATRLQAAEHLRSTRSNVADAPQVNYLEKAKTAMRKIVKEQLERIEQLCDSNGSAGSEALQKGYILSTDILGLDTASDAVKQAIRNHERNSSELIALIALDTEIHDHFRTAFRMDKTRKAVYIPLKNLTLEQNAKREALMRAILQNNVSVKTVYLAVGLLGEINKELADEAQHASMRSEKLEKLRIHARRTYELAGIVLLLFDHLSLEARDVVYRMYDEAQKRVSKQSSEIDILAKQAASLRDKGLISSEKYAQESQAFERVKAQIVDTSQASMLAWKQLMQQTRKQEDYFKIFSKKKELVAYIRNRAKVQIDTLRNLKRMAEPKDMIGAIEHLIDPLGAISLIALDEEDVFDLLGGYE